MGVGGVTVRGLWTVDENTHPQTSCKEDGVKLSLPPMPGEAPGAGAVIGNCVPFNGQTEPASGNLGVFSGRPYFSAAQAKRSAAQKLLSNPSLTVRGRSGVI